MSEYKLDLGTCCVCGDTHRVNTVILLRLKCPIPGRGWGCFECDLPADGACIVVCDYCCMLRSPEDVVATARWACRGMPATDGRVPIESLAGDHWHDMSRHPEEAAPVDPPGPIWLGGNTTC